MEMRRDSTNHMESSSYSQMSQDSLSMTGATTSGTPMPNVSSDDLPPRDDDVDLVALAAQKRRELFELDELRVRAMSKQVDEKDNQLSKLKQTMARLREDFEFNLVLIGERDEELIRFESQTEELASRLHQSEQINSQVQTAHSDALARCERLEDQLRLAQVQYQERLTRAEKTFAALRKSLESTHAQTHEDLRYQVKTLESELAVVKEENEQKDAKHVSLTSTQLDTLKAEHQRELHELKHQVSDAIARGEAVGAELTGVKQQNTDAVLKIRELENTQEELRLELKASQERVQSMQEEREEEMKRTKEKEKTTALMHDKVLEEHETKLSTLLSSLKKVQEQAQASQHRHETYQQTLATQHAQELADRHSEWQAQLTAAETNAGMHIQRADRLEQKMSQDAAKTQERIKALQEEIDGLRKAVLVATTSSERISLEAVERSTSEVEQYVQAREHAEAALAEQTRIADELRAECARAKQDAAAAEERASREEEKARQAIHEAESLANDLKTQLKQVTANQKEQRNQKSDGENTDITSVPNSLLFDGDFGPPSPLFSPTSTKLSPTLSKVSQTSGSGVQHLGTDPEINPVFMSAENSETGVYRQSGQSRMANNNNNQNRSDQDGDSALRLQNERLAQALSEMRKDVERLSATVPHSPSAATGVNNNLLGAQVLSLQQQVSLLFEQVKKQSGETNSRDRGLLADVSDTNSSQLLSSQQVLSLQQNFERAKRKLKRAAAEREKLTELSNQLKSKLEHLERQNQPVSSPHQRQYDHRSPHDRSHHHSSTETLSPNSRADAAATGQGVVDREVIERQVANRFRAKIRLIEQALDQLANQNSTLKRRLAAQQVPAQREDTVSRHHRPRRDELTPTWDDSASDNSSDRPKMQEIEAGTRDNNMNTNNKGNIRNDSNDKDERDNTDPLMISNERTRTDSRQSYNALQDPRHRLDAHARTTTKITTANKGSTERDTGYTDGETEPTSELSAQGVGFGTRNSSSSSNSRRGASSSRTASMRPNQLSSTGRGRGVRESVAVAAVVTTRATPRIRNYNVKD